MQDPLSTSLLLGLKHPQEQPSRAADNTAGQSSVNLLTPASGGVGLAGKGTETRGAAEPARHRAARRSTFYTPGAVSVFFSVSQSHPGVRAMLRGRLQETPSTRLVPRTHPGRSLLLSVLCRVSGQQLPRRALPPRRHSREEASTDGCLPPGASRGRMRPPPPKHNSVTPPCLDVSFPPVSKRGCTALGAG